MQTPQAPVTDPVPAGSADPRAGRRFYRKLALVGAVGVLLIAAVAVVILRSSGRPAPSTGTISSGQPSALAALMGMSDMPNRPAPNFTLTDQHGQTMSLSAFRGKAVVLEFMDPHCIDICPIVSQEFVQAWHDLGATANRVVFVAVNVNPFHESVTSVAAFTAEHGLSAVPNWHFFTGSTAALQQTWKNYGIYVQAPNPTADVIHSSYIFFIDPQGHERYLASPTVDHTAQGVAFLPPGTMAQWGHGIAQYARDLLAPSPPKVS